MPRPENKEEVIYGIHPVATALGEDATAVTGVWVLDAGRQNARIQALLQAAQAHHIPVHLVARHELDIMANGGHHQGVLVRRKGSAQHAPASLEELLAGLSTPPLLLVLDGVQDPHNLGACMRTAAAAGVDGVVVPRDRAVGITPVVRKVACGAADTVPFFQVTNLARTLRMLKEQGLWIVGADAHAKESIYHLDLHGSVAWVLGAEGRGLRRLTREHCDFLAHIPLAGTMESLNVSVSAGICLYEVVRQRLQGALKGG